MSGMRFDFECPHCHKHVGFSVTPSDETVTRQLTPAERAEVWMQTAPQAVRRFFEDLERAGVLASWRVAIDHMGAGHRPGNAAKFLLSFMRRVDITIVKASVLHRLADHFGGIVNVYSANGIAVVTSDGYIKAFVASDVLEQLEPARAGLVDHSEEWVKTRFGYVTSHLLYDDFRRRSLGAFDEMSRRPR